ncbi:MAG: hypothetical protein ABI679_13820 [Gemmatimonadota bacterium]
MKPVALLLLLSLAPPALLAQDPRLVGRLDSATARVVTAVIDSSRELGLPTEPLVQKALEGASKSATGDRIIAAVRILALNLGTARTALGRESSEQELVAGVAALRAGATPGAIRGLRQARASRGVAVPLAVLADLVALGVQVDAAYQSVLDLARTEADDAAFARLKQQYAGQRQP